MLMHLLRYIFYPYTYKLLHSSPLTRENSNVEIGRIFYYEREDGIIVCKKIYY